MCCVFLQAKNTPLHLASRKGRGAVVEQLINNGVPINQTNKVSWSIFD